MSMNSYSTAVESETGGVGEVHSSANADDIPYFPSFGTRADDSRSSHVSGDGR